MRRLSMGACLSQKMSGAPPCADFVQRWTPQYYSKRTNPFMFRAVNFMERLRDKMGPTLAREIGGTKMRGCVTNGISSWGTRFCFVATKAKPDGKSTAFTTDDCASRLCHTSNCMPAVPLVFCGVDPSPSI